MERGKTLWEGKTFVTLNNERGPKEFTANSDGFKYRFVWVAAYDLQD